MTPSPGSSDRAQGFRPPELPERSSTTPRRRQRTERTAGRLPIVGAAIGVVLLLASGAYAAVTVDGGDDQSATTDTTELTDSTSSTSSSSSSSSSTTEQESTSTTGAEGDGDGATAGANTIIDESEANLRMEPTSDADLVSTISAGADVVIDCWADGQQVTLAANGRASTVWVLLADPEQAWVSETLLADELDPSVPECSTGSAQLDNFTNVN